MLHTGSAVLWQERANVASFDALQSHLAYSEIGVFVGVEPSGLEASTVINVFSASGNSASITSGRLSYVLGLIGPCYSIDTACSSTLAALNVGMTATKGRACAKSVVIGTKILGENQNYRNSVAGMTSPLGRCHTFDARADGYCRGEGCSAFLFEWTTDLHIAVMSTAPVSAVQQDGPSASLTAPNGSSQ